MTPINDLIDQIKLSTDHQINKRLLKERVMADLHLPFNGGLFLLGPALLAFVSTWPEQELFLEDIYNNPIKIQRDEFLQQAREHYHAVMNTWHVEYEEIKRIRKI